jgi:simple sugar transport system ATP-binding protein
VSPATPDLELVALSKRFGDVAALDAAHFHLQPGTVHALLGENGAGKTTLMRIAYGMLAPDRGSIRLDGRATVHRAPADAIANGIAMVHQHFSLVPAMSAVENFALGGRGRFDRSRAAERLARCAAPLGLDITPDVRVDTMSAAEQQQLEIAKALGRECRVLILDEPTAVLTPMHATALLQWLRAYAAMGNSVVLITHKLRDAVSAADDVTVLRHGRTVLEARIADVDERALLAAMLGTPHAEGDVGGGANRVVAPVRHGPVVAAFDSVSGEDSSRREYLAHVTLDIHAGEIVGIAGLDGSGHRLLLRILAGRRAPGQGRIVLPSRIAFVPEDRQREGIAAQLSVRDNIALRGAGSRRGWMRGRHWDNLTRRLINEFDVHARDGQVPTYTLSGGNQQRLVLARELADHPELIVAENPTRGLDVRAAEQIRARLRTARDKGVAIVFYSSDLDEIVAECDRVVVVYDGRVRDVQPTRDAIGRALLGAGR